MGSDTVGVGDRRQYLTPSSRSTSELQLITRVGGWPVAAAASASPLSGVHRHVLHACVVISADLG